MPLFTVSGHTLVRSNGVYHMVIRKYSCWVIHLAGQMVYHIVRLSGNTVVKSYSRRLTQSRDMVVR